MASSKHASAKSRITNLSKTYFASVPISVLEAQGQAAVCIAIFGYGRGGWAYHVISEDLDSIG